MEKQFFQNIQINACKKLSGKLVFARGFGGYCGNKEHPLRVLTHIHTLKSLKYQLVVEMRRIRLGY